MSKVKYKLNLERIDFLIKFYQITKEDFIAILNGKNKRKLFFEDLKNPINITSIKRLDKVFDEGLTWYINEKPPLNTKESSIFFRKKNFNSALDLGDRRIVNDFEEKKILIEILSENINHHNKRRIRKLSINDNVEETVKMVMGEYNKIKDEIRNLERIKCNNTKEDDKKYLKNLMNILEHFGVFIFEFLERHNTKLKVNFDGFYLENTIVIKREKNIRREIFTLLHEFAHFLLEEEEIDKNTEDRTKDKIEKWCNEFAFQFLLFNNREYFKKLNNPNEENNFYKEEIIELTRKTHLNPLPFYLNFFYSCKISLEIYNYKKEEIKENYQKRLRIENEELRKQDELKKALGGKPSPKIPKPLISNSFKELVLENYNDGYINEVELCRYLMFSKRESEKFCQQSYS